MGGLHGFLRAHVLRYRSQLQFLGLVCSCRWPRLLHPGFSRKFVFVQLVKFLLHLIPLGSFGETNNLCKCPTALPHSSSSHPPSARPSLVSSRVNSCEGLRNHMSTSSTSFKEGNLAGLLQHAFIRPRSSPPDNVFLPHCSMLIPRAFADPPPLRRWLYTPPNRERQRA